MTLQIPAYCLAGINTPSHNMLASANRRRRAVIVAPEQGSLPKAGFPASIVNALANVCLLYVWVVYPLKLNVCIYSENEVYIIV